MNVNLIAWAVNQALPPDERAVLSLMALLAADGGSGNDYLGNLPTLAICCVLPLERVRLAVARMCELGLLSPTLRGYQLQAGVLAA